MTKKALVIRLCAYGDAIHFSHIPRLLKDQGYDIVDVLTNFKGYQLLGYNPFIDNLKFYEPDHRISEYHLMKHFDVESEGYDKVINLYKSLEYGVLSMEDTNEYYMSTNVRRGRYSDQNYYDVTTIAAGYPELVGFYKGELFYPKKEIDVVENWAKKFAGKWLVMMNVCGTGPHKEMAQREEIINHILSTYPQAHIILTGGKEYGDMDVKNDRVTSIIGKYPMRQAVLITRYVDLMITLESGIGVASTMWGTPTIQMMTAANLTAHCKYAKNDLSIQSPCYCSPCHKGPYRYIGCPNKNGKPLCVYFDLDKVFGKIKEGYDLYRKGYQRTYPNSTELSAMRNVAPAVC